MLIPSEHLSVKWHEQDSEFTLSLPWMSMEIEVEKEDMHGIKSATTLISEKNYNQESVQSFLQSFKDYPVSYKAPRSLHAFAKKDLQQAYNRIEHYDFSTPKAFVQSAGISCDGLALTDLPDSWGWDLENILSISKLNDSDPSTPLYDPMTVVSYLVLYRLAWESSAWSGQNGLGDGLEKLLKKDESQFFDMIAWVTKQSHYVTREFHESVRPGLEHFKPAQHELEHFITDEIGHHKFMEQVFQDIDRDANEYQVGAATKWMLAIFKQLGTQSPLAFSAMVNIFEAAYYEGEDPLSRVLRQSSKPHAAYGYDTHYKINQEHRHCDMPVILASKCAPQPRDHVELTVRLFEVTLLMLDKMEQNQLSKYDL